MENLALIVGGERQHQGALMAQFDVDATRAQKLISEAGPTRLAVAAERDQCLLAGLRLATGSEHAGRGVARARAGLAAVEHRDRRTARGEAPSNAKADHAGADDGNARFTGGMGKTVRQRRLPSLE